jgi:hypothetical protein
MMDLAGNKRMDVQRKEIPSDRRVLRLELEMKQVDGRE